MVKNNNWMKINEILMNFNWLISEWINEPISQSLDLLTVITNETMPNNINV